MPSSLLHPFHSFPVHFNDDNDLHNIHWKFAIYMYFRVCFSISEIWDNRKEMAATKRMYEIRCERSQRNSENRVRSIPQYNKREAEIADSECSKAYCARKAELSCMSIYVNIYNSLSESVAAYAASSSYAARSSAAISFSSTACRPASRSRSRHPRNCATTATESSDVVPAIVYQWCKYLSLNLWVSRHQECVFEELQALFTQLGIQRQTEKEKRNRRKRATHAHTKGWHQQNRKTFEQQNEKFPSSYTEDVMSAPRRRHLV